MYFDYVCLYCVMICLLVCDGEYIEICYVYLKLGFVWMDFVLLYCGVVFVYDFGDGKVWLCLFGMYVLFVLMLLLFNLFVCDCIGYWVDCLDVGELLCNVYVL